MISALIKDPLGSFEHKGKARDVAACLAVIFAVYLYMFLKRHDRKPIDLAKYGWDL